MSGLTAEAMYMDHATMTPATNTKTAETSSISATTPLWPLSWMGNTGARKRSNRVPCSEGIPNATPVITVSNARIHSGKVITPGDSWTWWAASRVMRGPL